MVVDFLVERYSNDQTEERLLESIKLQGHNLTLVKNLPFYGGAEIDGIYRFSNTILPDDRPCVFIGSLNLSKKLRYFGCSYITYRGNWCNLPQYACHKYYPHLRGNLLNYDYVMLPFGDLWPRWNDLQSYLGTESLFIRPDAGDKPFTGMVVRDIGDLRKIECTARPDDLVLISTPKQIKSEHRIVVIDGVAVAGSMYRNQGLLSEYGGLTEELKQYAEYIAKLHQPDRAFVVDICYPEGTGKTPRVVELNSFSCSGFYTCNTDVIVKEIASLAIREFEDEKH